MFRAIAVASILCLPFAGLMAAQSSETADTNASTDQVLVCHGGQTKTCDVYQKEGNRALATQPIPTPFTPVSCIIQTTPDIADNQTSNQSFCSEVTIIGPVEVWGIGLTSQGSSITLKDTTNSVLGTCNNPKLDSGILSVEVGDMVYLSAIAIRSDAGTLGIDLKDCQLSMPLH